MTERRTIKQNKDDETRNLTSKFASIPQRKETKKRSKSNVSMSEEDADYRSDNNSDRDHRLFGTSDNEEDSNEIDYGDASDMDVDEEDSSHIKQCKPSKTMFYEEEKNESKD